MKRTLVAVALVVIFLLALATPAFAMFHTATVKMDGTIDFRSQAGHACNTGGVMKQTIAGSGTLDKAMTVLMKPGILTVNDANDFVAGATPLTVTSVWELCTPPKYTVDVEDDNGDEITVPVSIKSLYFPDADDGWNTPASYIWVPNLIHPIHGALGPMNITTGYTVEMLADWDEWDALTSQIWAVQVQANPGFSGNLSQSGEAAYGNYWGDDEFTWESGWNKDLTGSPYGEGWGKLSKKDSWRWEYDKDDLLGYAVGADFVGDYFTMEQHARTSQGTVRRYVDISSPWNHGYLHLDMSVVGKSDIKDAFEMTNLPAGKDVPKDWWRLF